MRGNKDVFTCYYDAQQNGIMTPAVPLYEVFLREALALVFWTTLPVIAAILVASVLVSALQALTQVNDTTISLVSHLIAAAGVIVTCGYWMLARDAAFLASLMHHLTRYINQPWS